MPDSADAPETPDVPETTLEQRVDQQLGLPEVKSAVDTDTTDTTDDTTTDGVDSQDDPAPEPQSEGEEDSVEEETETTPQEPSNAEIFIEVEDANGNKFKISKIEDLPEDFTPKNNRQALEILAQTQDLQQRIKEQEAAQAQQAQEAVIKSAQDQIQKSWDNDISTLIKEGTLDKPKFAENNPKYAEDPAVQKVDAVFDFIKKENETRKADGNTNLLTSFRDAFDLMSFRELRAEQTQAQKDETSRAKAKAGIIGTNSSTPGDTYAYRAGSARTIDDVPIN